MSIVRVFANLGLPSRLSPIVRFLSDIISKMHMQTGGRKLTFLKPLIAQVMAGKRFHYPKKKALLSAQSAKLAINSSCLVRAMDFMWWGRKVYFKVRQLTLLWLFIKFCKHLSVCGSVINALVISLTFLSDMVTAVETDGFGWKMYHVVAYNFSK